MSALTCPSCEKPLRVPDGFAGRSVRCPACSHRFEVPSPPQPDEDEALDLPDDEPPARPRRSGSYSRAPQHSGGRVAIIVGVVVLVLGVGAGAVWLATGNKPRPEGQERADAGTSPTAPKAPTGPAGGQQPAADSQPKPPVKPPKDDATATKFPAPKPPSDPADKKPKDQPPAKADDRKWVAEAKAEYRDALQEKERRKTAFAKKLGELNQGEYEMAKAALEAVRQAIDSGTSVADLPPDLVKDAKIVAPDYIAAHQREGLVNSPDYPELVKNGAVPQYHTTAKRKELYAEFASATGDKAEWSVSRPFAALTAKEMDSLMEGVRLLKDGGLGKLTKAQRLLLLKAGALAYFGSQLPKE